MATTTAADALDEGRAAFDRREWVTAVDRLTAADLESALQPEDLVRLATAAYLTGRDAESTSTWERAHHEYLRRGEVPAAVRSAFWLGLGLVLRGEMGRAGGWLARCQRLIDDARLDCPERGLLLVPLAIRHIDAGDFAAARDTFDRAVKIGERFGDADLTAMARQGQGRALIRLGDTDGGIALLDEVMIAVTSGEVSPIPSGLIYCSVIEACHEVFDMRRAHEWTAALSDWCASQPDLVPYRGQCLVHRCQLMQLRGDWRDAMAEVQLACQRLSAPPGHPAMGMASYQQAELHRLRGEYAAAEQAYRLASQWGHTPQPGLAQLRLAQGRLDTAVAAIRGAADEARHPLSRARVLTAYVEIMLAAGDVPAARAGADELAQIAGGIGAPLLQAGAAHARGAVLLAEGDPRAALDTLRTACDAWAALGAPHEGARSRVLVGVARRALSDDDTAELDFDAARQVFQRLGAAPDLASLDALTRRHPARDAASGLSPREVEVLRLVAAGKTNHAIASELFLSEKTVARHVSNIFTKLRLSSRAAATAYAYEHGLV